MNLIFIGTVLFNIRFISSNSVNIDEYCKLKCNKPDVKHTICEFKCEISSECINFKEFPLNDNDRQYVLDVHNALRNYLASGQDKRGGNGAAKDMLVMKYDKDIEITTSCWGRRCTFAHDKCRQIPKYKSAGQNLYLRSSTQEIEAKDLQLLNTSILEWYVEIEDTTKEIIQKFDKSPDPQKKIGHFTQLVWASTEQIGCTRVTYEDKSDPAFPYNIHFLCNYSPAGNIRTLPVYQFGSGCTPPMEPNDEYTSLCGESKLIFEERVPNPIGNIDAIQERLTNVDKPVKSTDNPNANVPTDKGFKLHLNIVTVYTFYILISCKVINKILI